MSAPMITADMRLWAEQYVFSCRDVAAMKGEEFDADAATAAIREALTTGSRWNPADDYDFTHDEGDQDVSGGLADRASDREHKWMQGGA